MQVLRPPFLLPALLLCVGCAAKSADTGSPEAPAGPSSGELRVLTYNVAGLPDGISSAEGALLDRMPAIAALLQEYDIVSLQEDFDEDAHAALTEGTGQAQVTWFSATVDDTRFYGSGLSQLLPTPPTDVYEQHYSACNGVTDGASDCLASKGFQATSIALGGARLDLYNTHHEAGGGEADNTARATQVDELLTAVVDRSDGHAVLLSGDFNLRLTDPEDVGLLTAYDDAGLPRACDLLSCPEPDHIDHIRVRSGTDLQLEVLDWSRETRFVTEDGAALSDHPAIAITLAWRTGGPD